MCRTKEDPLPKHKAAGEWQLKAKRESTLSTQAVIQSLQKRLVSNGKSMGSDNRIAERAWRVLWQAKLHQQVFTLSMEDDKDDRWLGVGGVMGSERTIGKMEKNDLVLLVTRHGLLGCQGGRSGGLQPWSSSS